MVWPLFPFAAVLLPSNVLFPSTPSSIPSSPPVSPFPSIFSSSSNDFTTASSVLILCLNTRYSTPSHRNKRPFITASFCPVSTPSRKFRDRAG